MIELNRAASRYKEIESFADYELTQCIAYELAIRNCEVIKLKNKIDELLKIVWYEFTEARDNDRELLEEYEKTEEEYYEKLDDDDFDNDDLDIPDFHQYFLDRNNNAPLIKEKIQTLLNGYWIRHIYEDGIINEAATMLGEDSTIAQDIFQNKQVKRLREHGFLGIFEQVGVSKDNRVVSSNDIGFVFGRSNNTCKEVDLNKTARSQRLESLVIPKKYDTSIKIKINPNLPKNELIALIEKIKDNYTQDPSMIRSPVELLGELSDVSNTKISKKKLADKFFVYDYIKARLEQIDELNNEIKEDFDIDVQHIKDNPYLDWTDKTTQINMLKKDLRGNTINTSINDIFEEEELTSSIPKGTAKRYYYEMKPFIDDMKYKELITGIRT